MELNHYLYIIYKSSNHCAILDLKRTKCSEKSKIFIGNVLRKKTRIPKEKCDKVEKYRERYGS